MGLCIACETLLLQELGWCLPYFLIFFCGNISIPADALYREQYGIIFLLRMFKTIWNNTY